MKITKRRLIEDEVTVRGHSVIRRSVVVNGDTYTLELDPISGDRKFYINREYISEGNKAYADFEEATGIRIKHFEKYQEKIKYGRFNNYNERRRK